MADSDSSKDRLPGYKRAKQPPGMRLTSRDREVLVTIYRYDGMLAVDQVHRWFFPGAGNKRNAQRRISLLFHNRYLRRPRRQDFHRIPEPVVWLDKLGAEIVAQQLEMEVSALPWRDTPRWGDVAHDIGQNEVRHMIETAATDAPHYQIEEWYGRDDLWRTVGARPVAYLSQEGERLEKRVVPDGYFRLRVQDDASDTTHDFRFLLEFDNGTFPHSRFARDKVSPNVHLVLSRWYEQHIGAKGGRFLVVVRGRTDRYHNMRQTITQAGGASYFLLAHYEALVGENVVEAPVWQLPHHDRRVSLLEYGRPAFQKWLTASVQDTPKLQFLRNP